MTEKEQKLFDMQPESTRKAMLRDPKTDTWPPNDWKRDCSIQRAITEEEYKVIGLQRHHAGKHLAVMRNEPDASSVDTAKRERALDAYMIATADQTNIRFKNIMQDPYSQMILEEKAKISVGFK